MRFSFANLRFTSSVQSQVCLSIFLRPGFVVPSSELEASVIIWVADYHVSSTVVMGGSWLREVTASFSFSLHHLIREALICFGGEIFIE